MSESLEVIVRIIAYGVPALLIAFGAIMILSGYTMNLVAPDSGNGLIGIGLLFVLLGASIYVYEIYASSH